MTRWGDYGAAVADSDGSIWIASEFTSARPRYIYGNWGTFVSNVNVDSGEACDGARGARALRPASDAGRSGYHARSHPAGTQSSATPSPDSSTAGAGVPSGPSQPSATTRGLS